VQAGSAASRIGCRPSTRTGCLSTLRRVRLQPLGAIGGGISHVE
jgi:hypothetical protein